MVETIMVSLLFVSFLAGYIVGCASCNNSSKEKHDGKYCDTTPYF